MNTSHNDIEIQRSSHRGLPLAEEIAFYREKLPEFLAHEGEFVLIKGKDVVGFYSDRRLAQRTGYERFGIVPFLVKQVEQVESVTYLSNIVL